MRRKAIAAVWIAGATLPLLLAAAFLVGCCVLPFHRVLHQLMPLCEMAVTAIRGEHSSTGQDHPATPPAPARQKDESVKQMATALPGALRLLVLQLPQSLVPSNPDTGYRSFITLGAIRCDQDVGLHLLIATFRI